MNDERQRQEIQELLRVVHTHGVEVDPGCIDRLVFYCQTLEAWNDRSGLVSPHDLPYLIWKHVALSLAPLLIAEPRTDSRWIDVGTGGGLPGMVIKLCRPELDITLLDSSRKKTIFLEHLQERLRVDFGLGRLTVLETRVENLRSDDYEVILMRAVGSLKKTLPLLAGITRPAIRLMTFKGERLADELRAAKPTMMKLGWTIESQRSIPWGRTTLLSLMQRTV